MKKRYIFSFLTALIIVSGLFLLRGLEIEAGVKGKCANCHTMHNSRDGETEGLTQPQTYLLVMPPDTPEDNPCLGCHTNPDVITAIDDDESDDVSIAPQVDYYGTTEEEKMLAGGTYHFVDDSETGRQKGHNVIGIGDGAVDPVLGITPPGGTNMSDTYNECSECDRLTCAGTFGCHGNRREPDPIASIKGGHHSSVNDSYRDGSDIANSYRMLLGVQGRVGSKWEFGKTNQLLSWDQLKEDKANVNIYKAIDLKNGGPQSTKYTPGSGGSINGLCGECHGNAHDNHEGGFHSLKGIRSNPDDPNSPWKRHPTDVVMDKGEYLGYPNGAEDYSTEVPVGFNIDFGNKSLGNLESSKGVVLCTSCHRAHGSEYDDALRWDYDEILIKENLDKNNGCFRCHTQKNK